MGYTQLLKRDEILQPCKKGLPAERGSIWWVPVTFVDEVPRILEATRADPRDHTHADFRIRDTVAGDFRRRDKLPVKGLSLKETEEAIVVKAKRRPCVVLSAAEVSRADLESISDGAQQRQAQALASNTYLVAPLFSCAAFGGDGTFGPIITARIKSLIYPQFFYLPALDPADTKSAGDVIRLDRVFPTVLGRGCESIGQRMSPDAFDSLMMPLFSVHCGGLPTDYLSEIRNDLWDAIADDGYMPRR